MKSNDNYYSLCVSNSVKQVLLWTHFTDDNRLRKVSSLPKVTQLVGKPKA